MAEEYIKKEDAIKSVVNHDILKGKWSRDWAEYMLEDAKPADVVPVVRCKDCVSFHYSGMGGDNGITYCAKGIEMQPTDFCSYGERKDNG